jgi:hypothetical protein
MTEELYDDDFHVSYPSWLIVHESCITGAREGEATFAGRIKWLCLHDDASGESSLAIFTDEHLAESFVEASGLPDAAIIAAENARRLADFLELADGLSAAALVVFDPEKATGWTRRVWPIAYVVQRLRKGKGLR